MTELVCCATPPHALLHVSGADAEAFLQAQLTQDFRALAAPALTLAAWLSPQGRVQGVFDIVVDDESYWLITATDNIAWLTTALARYVLRSDVEIDGELSTGVRSVCGSGDEWLGERGVHFGDGPVVRVGSLLFVRTSPSRIDVIGEPDRLDRELAGLPAATAETVIRTMIADGRTPLTAALRGRYTAHMLNLDRLGGVSFTKGCYPGQEIVARTENLGRARRRLRRFVLAAGERPAVGDEIAEMDGRIGGEVVCVASGDDGHELLAVVAVDAANLALAGDGRVLTEIRPTSAT